MLGRLLRRFADAKKIQRSFDQWRLRCYWARRLLIQIDTGGTSAQHVSYFVPVLGAPLGAFSKATWGDDLFIASSIKSEGFLVVPICFGIWHFDFLHAPNGEIIRMLNTQCLPTSSRCIEKHIAAFARAGPNVAPLQLITVVAVWQWIPCWAFWAGFMSNSLNFREQ